MIYALCAILLLLAVVTGATFAARYAQNALNGFSGTGMHISVDLIIYERDLHGNETTNPVSGSEFYLFRENGGGDQQIGGRYLTGDDGIISSPPLPPGTYYFIETFPSIGYTFDYDPDLHGQIRYYPFTITGDETEPLVVTAYNRRLIGKLDIRKLAQNADGSPLTDAQRNQTFSFTVQFGDDGTYPYTISGGSPQDLTSGDVIALRHGETASFAELPVGLWYRVTEAPEPGWHMQADSHSGTIPEADATALFTNTWDDAGFGTADMSLLVEKEVTGEAPDPDQSFRFTLFVDGQKTLFQLKHGESASFTLSPGAVYEVLEADSFADGFLSSVTNGHGIAKEGDPLHVRQVNRYAGRVNRIISGEKHWDLTASPAAILPNSVIISVKNGEQVVETRTVKKNKDGKWLYSFTIPKYDGAGGIIDYVVKEDQIPGFISSVQGYDITNTFVQPVIPGDPPVKKRVEGDTPKEAGTFHFHLTGHDGAPMPPGSSGSTKSATVVGSGPVEFGNMVFTNPGTYVYTISEIIPDFAWWHSPGETELDHEEDWYEYDETIYTLTYVVQEQNGALSVASRTIRTEDGSVKDQAEFVNTFNEVTEREVVDPPPPNPPDPEDPNPPGPSDPPIAKPDPEEGDKPGAKVVVSGKKTWVHGKNKASRYPKEILLSVKADGKVVIQASITAKDGWKWNYSLNKYNPNGYLIQYTVDEKKVPGYKKKIQGYNITNTWDGSGADTGGGDGKKPDGDGKKPGSGGGSGGGSGDSSGGGKGHSPDTGDQGSDRALRILLAVMLIDLALLILLVTLRGRMGRRFDPD